MYSYRRWAIEDPMAELDRKGVIFLPIHIAWQDEETGLYVQVSPCNWRDIEPGTVIPWDIDILGREGEDVHKEFSVGIPALSPKRPEGLLRQALKNVLYRCEIPQPVALNIHKFAESLKEV